MPIYAVLVVDSDPLALMNTMRNVAEAGFIAYGALDADTAIDVLEQHDDIRVLFTEITSHWMNDALKLAHAVRDRWPPMTIVVMSGDACVSAVDLPIGGIFVDRTHAMPGSPVPSV